VSVPLPLAGASQRLKGKPGRPPLGDEEKSRRAEERRRRQAAALALVNPRLFDVPAAAKYMGVSRWTIMDLISNGTLPRVTVGDMRRLLIDRNDCDRLIESSK
jgi:excisionase family DNA binding protein